MLYWAAFLAGPYMRPYFHTHLPTRCAFSKLAMYINLDSSDDFMYNTSHARK